MTQKGESLMDSMIDWEVFDYKFRDDLSSHFEKLASEIFYRLHKIPIDSLGINHDLCQFEPEFMNRPPVSGNSFVTMYVPTSYITNRHLHLFEGIIRKAFSAYKNLSILYFFVNRPFSSSSIKGKEKTLIQEELEKTAEEFGVSIHWFLPNEFEIILLQDDMKDLREYYFSINAECKRPYWRTTNTLYKYMDMRHLESCIQKGIYASNIGNNDPSERQGVRDHELYRKCTMTNSPKQMILWAYYGGHRGCCVEYDVSNVDKVLLRKAEYTDTRISRFDMSPLEIREDLYKRGIEWKHENEYCAVFYRASYDKDAWSICNENEVFLKAKVKSVMFGLYAEDLYDDYLKALRIIKEYGIEAKKCRIKPGEYRISPDPQFDIDAEILRLTSKRKNAETKQGGAFVYNNYGICYLNGDVVHGDKNVMKETSQESRESCHKGVQPIGFNFYDNSKYEHSGDNIEGDKIVTGDLSQKDKEKLKE